MLDKKGAKNLFDQVYELWIKSEILGRKQTGSLPENFKIFRCLIRLPKDRGPIIEFNDEIKWVVLAKSAPGTSFKKGETVFLRDIQEIVTVRPPEVDGERVAFIYVFRMGKGYQIIFDFEPKIPERFIPKEEKGGWNLSKTVAESLQAILTEKAVRIHDKTQSQLQKIGLWAAPALLPYPISKIAKQLEDGDTEGAKATLVEHCSPALIEELSSKWWTVEQFELRKGLIQDALDGHKEGKYRVGIYLLLPHVEGVITDWICTKLPAKEIPWRQESKTKRFRDLVLERPPSTFTYKRIVESTVDFILGGPVLKTFQRWIDEIDEAFPNRHVVEHGKYDESLFTEENSIKLFLLLDTVYHIISAQLEVR